jgi:hypothetical protein
VQGATWAGYVVPCTTTTMTTTTTTDCGVSYTVLFCPRKAIAAMGTTGRRRKRVHSSAGQGVTYRDACHGSSMAAEHGAPPVGACYHNAEATASHPARHGNHIASHKTGQRRDFLGQSRMHTYVRRARAASGAAAAAASALPRLASTYTIQPIRRMFLSFFFHLPHQPPYSTRLFPRATHTCTASGSELTAVRL